MRKLYLGNGDKQFKFADTTTEIHLNAFDDGSAANLTNDAKVRIKNDSGYLLGVSASITDNHAVITSGQLAQLPVGSYLIELWNTVDGGTAIYPSDGFLALQINENVTGLSGGLVSSITVDDFIQQFSDLSQQLKQEVAVAIANGLKGDKGDDGLSAYQIAVINGYKGSQTDWLASLVGAKGDKGDKGDPGDAITRPQFNTVITYPSNVTYKINSDSTMLVTFVRNDVPVIISYPGVQKRVPVEASYTLKSSEALVYNSRDNSLVALNFDSLLPDSVIIIANYNGAIQNNINAVQGDGDYEYYSDGTENVIYYAGVVTAKKNGASIDVNFDLSLDTRLFYKDSAGNHVMSVANNMYTVPHNFSLVLNRETKSLEAINTDNVIRGVHSILITCHQGFAKKVGMYFNSLSTDAIKMPTSGKIPINRYKTFVGQDATKVGNEYWLFDGSNPDHTSTTSIHRINPTDFSEIGLITHNLGHANGVDYRDNTLLVYNGSGLPPEINLYKSPDNTMTNLKIQDAANTQIIFKESSKLLPGDGSACFGLDNKIVYYAYCSGTQVIILKILLGLGDNDLSDKTTDKSNNQHWGSFVSGKSNDEYNGTAQIISSYTGDISGDNQPQGMAFNGYLYLGTSHSEQKAYQLQLLDNGSFKVVDDYKSETTDYKNNVIGLEPEITFIDPEKRSVFVGGRGSLSNVAEFNL